MGLTDTNGFPCCGKESVDIVETQNDLHLRQSQSQGIQEEDEKELEPEPLEQVSPAKVDLDLDPDLEMESDVDMELESKVALQPLWPADTPKAEAGQDLTDVESYDEDPDQQRYTMEPVSSCTEALPTQQDLSQWNLKSHSSCLSSTEEQLAATSHRSICVQTSKHLFRADKLIQASEHSLQEALRTQLSKGHPVKLTSSHPKQQAAPNPTLCSEKQPQPSRAQAPLPTRSSQELPSSPCLSSSSLPLGINLSEVINFASSLAVASSSRRDLPSLESTIRAPSQKTLGSPTKPAREPAAQPPMKELRPEEPVKVLPERPHEKPRECGESQNACSREAVGFANSCLDFSKPGVRRATIEGKVKFLQPPALAPPPQAARKDAVPGTKKGSPLLLQIHFKLASPSSPEK
ncbi:spermatogenesis-associated protein 32 [Dasypus novemcinctus]|uniref:spermatogenesis-associated protein 32 n=1 Tax=Dasypus novemcinctus TaxID=9361 RepID=UPI00265E6C45|nr:spermatogenesis-associated protein 32 [Dasypus novemcinctus]